MDRYHVYQELGKGKHSTVYKARRKKTIHYYAIKSVDIAQKSRVLQEIETMHALEHSHVLKFHRWYETGRHLWLVLEYCVGGDLKSLLEKDRQLPEDSIHDFAAGLVSSLQYCHSQAVIYGDLKPSNLLLDENGRLKLGGFGLSKRLADINACALQPGVHPLAARSGTPAYMAPELFREDGVHSTASDLWALGCVLYECRMGRPPFTSNLLHRLIEDIEQGDPAPLQGEPNFVSLVMALLDKNPKTRLGWEGLRSHPFWQTPLPALPLPQEAALDAFIVRHYSPTAAGKQAASTVQPLPGVSALRVSRAVRSNLQADAGGATEYKGATAGAGTGDVQLHTPDAEVDFDDRGSDAGNSENGGEDGHGVDDSAREGAAAGAETAEHAAIISGAARVSMVGSPMVHVAVQEAQRQEAARRAERQMLQQQQQNQQQQQENRPRNQHSNGAGSPAGTTVKPRSPLTDAWGNVPASPRQPRAVEPGSADALIWHSSDNRITPIVGNPRIERLAQPKFDARTLPVPAWDAVGLMAAPDPDRENFLLTIYQALGSAAPIRDKTNMLAFMEGQLCCHTASANVLIDSAISGLLVRMLRGASGNKSGRERDGLRARLAGVLGLLLRHATFISPALAATGIVDMLTLAAGDKSEKVQRRAMAALGELLFYIAMQSDDDAAAAASPLAATHGSPHGAPVAGGWRVPNATVHLISQLTIPGVDEVTQHFAVHTIENVVLKGGMWAQRFADDALASNLVSIWQTSRNDALRGSAASALSRLVRHAPPQLAMLVTKFGTRKIVAGLGDASLKVQAACANILAIALASHELGGTTRATLQGGAVLDFGALHGALTLMGATYPPLKAKGCLLVALLVRHDASSLAAACSGGLPAAAEGVARAGQGWDAADLRYTTAALAALRREIAAVVPHIAEQVEIMAGPSKSNSAAARLRAAAWNVGGAALNYREVVAPLLGCPSLHSAAMSSGLVQSFASTLLATLAPADELMAEVQQEVIQAVEHTFVIGGPESAAAHGAALAMHLAPALAVAAGGASQADTRFQALKLLLDLLLLFLAAPDDAPADGGRGLVGELEATVTQRLLPRMGALLADEAPLPLYALRLLASLLEARHAWALALARAGLVPAVVDFLDLQHANNNRYNLRVARWLVIGGALPPPQLKALRVPHRVAEVLAYTHANKVLPFLEPVLELSAALLTHYKTPQGITEVCEALLPLLPVFVELVGCEDVGPATLAAQCAEALARHQSAMAGEVLFSREGALLVEAALCGAPPGAAGDPARRFLLLALVAAAPAVHGTCAAEPGAVRQLRGAVARLPTGGLEVEAAAQSAQQLLASLR